ncbi:hypothetical protein SO802_015299 [Lithocarpus litseifolius]|uniref:Uncharacterized protein n=1 Tax=Lithocarpus litseifolius TaxID=425828 RepID=A0AAW2CTA5_9ROSI
MIDAIDESTMAPDQFLKDSSSNVTTMKLKQIRDKLAIVSVILDDEELLHVALDGLPSVYD